MFQAHPHVPQFGVGLYFSRKVQVFVYVFAYFCFHSVVHRNLTFRKVMSTFFSFSAGIPARNQNDFALNIYDLLLVFSIWFTLV